MTRIAPRVAITTLSMLMPLTSPLWKMDSARKPAIAPTTIQAMKLTACVPSGCAAISADAVRGQGPARLGTAVRSGCGVRGWSGRLAPEDAHGPEHDQLEDRPADEGDDGRDIERRSARGQGIRVEDPLERGEEDLADVQDSRDQRVAGAGIEEEQDDPQPDDDLDEPEHEDDDPARHLGVAGARPRDLSAVRPDGLLRDGRCEWLRRRRDGRLARQRRAFLGDDGPVDLVECHAFSLCL